MDHLSSTLPEVYEVIPKWFYPHVQNSEGGAPW